MSILALIFCASLGWTQQAAKKLKFPEHTFLNKTVALSEHSKSLSSILDVLGHSIPFNVVVDGEPVRKAADISSAGSLRDALDQLCDLFDYDWTVTKSGIILLSKRFKAENERPQLNLPEMRQTFRDILAAIKPFDVKEDSTPTLRKLISTFTEEQSSFLNNKGKLSGGDLRADQYDLLVSAILYSHFTHFVSVIEQLLPHLDGMTSSYLQPRPFGDSATDPNAARGFGFMLYHVIKTKSGALNALKLVAYSQFRRE